jgi:hypothetical protein
MPRVRRMDWFCIIVVVIISPYYGGGCRTGLWEHDSNLILQKLGTAV